jgi:16S rRNA (adenine1518-N6/adenine1519-N6)-dimethyltransferase
VVRHQDILKFDLNELPLNYKVVANIPYYITGQIIRLFTESNSLPDQMVLLVQKEVAERIAAKPGGMRIKN